MTLTNKAQPAESAIDLESLELPVGRIFLKEIHRILKLSEVKIDELATCLAQDPVIVLELLKQANQRAAADGTSVIWTTSGAIKTLGVDRIVEIANALWGRSSTESGAETQAIEALRTEARRISMVARILAMATYKQLSVKVQTLGLLSTLGEMVACQVLGEDYIALSQVHERGELAREIMECLALNCAEIGCSFLQAQGIPQVIYAVFAAEDNGEVDNSLAITRQIVNAATELVHAYENGKWAAYQPERGLPSGSLIPCLGMVDRQYRKVYERCDEYFSISAAEEELAHEQIKSEAEAGSPLLRELLGMEAPEPAAGVPMVPAGPLLDYSESVRLVASGVERLLTAAENTQDLLDMLLYFLVTEGPFVRAALLVLASDGSSADVFRAVGGELQAGEKIAVDDPISPLRSGLTKVRSFNLPGLTDLLAPLGVPSYAVATLEMHNETPVVLYADCGPEGAMTFEARRIFRYVVDMINSKLPNLPAE